MSRSHAFTPKPTFLLALVALGIVSRLKPGWIAVELKTAAAEQNVRPERLSRLVSRAIALFEPIVAQLTRRGRPPGERDEHDTELAVTRALLEVTTELLSRLTLRGRRLRELVVGAYERLRSQYGISQKRFCEALSLSERTLRHWLVHAPQRPQQRRGEEQAKATDRPPKTRPPRRGRFGFDLVLPGTQIGADTTALSAFGVDLKLIAAQDIGGRDESLFDAVLVDDHESAELVARVLTEALGDKPGAQAITDQGTPYMAQATREVLDQLDAEHAPCREGDPIGKATVERALGTVKHIARPLLALTDRIAQTLPALRNTALAKAIANLVITALLRAYQHGARAARAALDARGHIDPGELARNACASREHARATERSTKLFLEHLHAAYRLAGKATDFVRSLRGYPLVVLREAERALHQRLLRDDLQPVRDPWRYFAAIVRRLNDEHRRRRQRQRQNELANRQLDRQHQQHTERMAAFRADPVAWLRHALDLLAMQWVPEQSALLFGGEGLGLQHLRRSLRHLCKQHDQAVADLVRGALHDFRLDHLQRLGEEGISAITALLERELAKVGTKDHCAPATASAILARTGKTPRPPPSDPLPI